MRWKYCGNMKWQLYLKSCDLSTIKSTSTFNNVLSIYHLLTVYIRFHYRNYKCCLLFCEHRKKFVSIISGYVSCIAMHGKWCYIVSSVFIISSIQRIPWCNSTKSQVCCFNSLCKISDPFKSWLHSGEAKLLETNNFQSISVLPRKKNGIGI